MRINTEFNEKLRSRKVIWKKILVAAAVGLVFVGLTRHESVYACSCAPGGEGLFIKNRESDDNTLKLPRDARGVLWWGQKQSLKKERFAVRLLSGPRERNLDFRVYRSEAGPISDRPD